MNEYKRKYTVAVIARNLEDYEYWVKDHKLKLLNGNNRLATDGKKKYIGMTMPEHTRGYIVNEIVSTDISYLNKNYDEIRACLQPCLIKYKKTNWFVKLFKKIFGR